MKAQLLFDPQEYNCIPDKYLALELTPITLQARRQFGDEVCQWCRREKYVDHKWVVFIPGSGSVDCYRRQR